MSMSVTRRIEEQALGVSRERAAEKRREIVAAATRLFRERGVEAVGLSELMKHAGFTQGGFYNHFESKAALVAEVLASAIAEGNGEFAKMARAPVDESTTALRRYISWYLSQAHREDIDPSDCSALPSVSRSARRAASADRRQPSAAPSLSSRRMLAASSHDAFAQTERGG